MSKLGSLYIELGEPEGELCGCDCEVGDWAADEIMRLRAELEKYRMASQVNNMLPNQEPLGSDFEKVLYDNLDSLYETTDTYQPTGDRVRELEKEVSLWKDRANQLSRPYDGQTISDYWQKVDALILRNKGAFPEASDQQ